MARGRWLTPESAGDSNIARCLIVPANLQPFVDWALEELAQSYNWELGGALSVDDTVAAFRALIDTYYESEDCTLAQSPDRFFALWAEAEVVAGNALAINLATTQALNTFWRQNASAQNDRVHFKAMLLEGTYTLNILGMRTSQSGKLHVIIDGSEDDETIDLYNATSIQDYAASITVTIVGSGQHTIEFKVSDKNASSSGYNANMSYIQLIRTGD